MDELRDVIAAATAQELKRNCVPPGTPGHPRRDQTVLQRLHVVLKEECQHHRYAGPRPRRARETARLTARHSAGHGETVHDTAVAGLSRLLPAGRRP